MADIDEPERPEKTPEGIADLPSIYVEVTHTTWWAGHLKIAFAEKIDGKRKWRTAILMEERDVRSMIHALNVILKEMYPPTSDASSKSAKDEAG